ncbi:hypothetical protein H6F98_29845 [Microcoleus sp. FACHB-SPT15]|uniref:hypothetical protein n=1 Tax=Microcoleus sp. FACHB-SPT15 TaxID=2692830 RepID=UPI0019B36585|nr:hypothetical protein [Microcoleus sp. FACHB-SPT15]MBD1809623.1 hypothetical protein [Microcoleus sp. FACHB-SPT15]
MKTVNLTPLLLFSRPKLSRGKEVMSALVLRSQATVEAFKSLNKEQLRLFSQLFKSALVGLA